MRKSIVRSGVAGLGLAILLGASSQASAGLVLEGSLGKGVMVKPSTKAMQTNVMLAPGYEFLWIRASLGIVGDLPDVQDSKFNLQLRPMITVAPPLLPIYGRVVVAIQNLGRSGDKTIAYGPVLGFSLSLAGIGVFAEAGLLPQKIGSETAWVVEGRAGVSYKF